MSKATNCKKGECYFEVSLLRLLAVVWMVLVGLLLGIKWAQAEGTVYNVVHTPNKVITCVLPVARTDGVALGPEELASVEYYIGGDLNTAPAAPTIVKTLDPSAPSCEQEIDFTALALGQHYLWASVTDDGGRQSARSTPVPFELIRVVAPPNAPTDGRFVDEEAP